MLAPLGSHCTGLSMDKRASRSVLITEMRKSELLPSRRAVLISTLATFLASRTPSFASGEDTWPYKGVKAIIVSIQDHVPEDTTQGFARELEIQAVDFLTQSLRDLSTNIIVVSRRRDTEPPATIHPMSVLTIILAITIETTEAPGVATGAIGIELRRDRHTAHMSNYPFEMFQSDAPESAIAENSERAIERILHSVIVEKLRKHQK